MRFILAALLSSLALAACSSTPAHQDSVRSTASMPEGALGMPMRPQQGMPPGAQGMPMRPPEGMPPGAQGMPMQPPSMHACVRVSGEAALNRAYEANDGSAQCAVDEVVPKIPKALYEVTVSCDDSHGYAVTVKTKETPHGCRVAGHPAVR